MDKRHCTLMLTVPADAFESGMLNHKFDCLPFLLLPGAPPSTRIKRTWHPKVRTLSVGQGSTMMDGQKYAHFTRFLRLGGRHDIQKINYADGHGSHNHNGAKENLLKKGCVAGKYPPKASLHGQAVDQGPGQFMQDGVQSRYIEWRSKYPNIKFDLAMQNKKMTHCVWQTWDDLCTNHKYLLKRAWVSSLLLKKIDGSEDIDAKSLFEKYNSDEIPRPLDANEDDEHDEDDDNEDDAKMEVE